jgi:hypothetical protein
MAETFQSVQQATTASFVTIYTAPALTSSIVIGFSAANTNASAAKDFSLQKVTSGGATTTVLANEISIPTNDALNPIQGKLVLEAGDYIQIKGTDTDIDCTVSILEIT